MLLSKSWTSELMKPCLIFTLSFLVFCLTLRAEERASYDALYKEAYRSYGVDDRLDYKWATWEGLGTPRGLEIAVSEVVAAAFTEPFVDSGRISFANYMLRNMKLPRQQVADYLMSLAKSVSDDQLPLLCYRLLMLDPYGSENGVVPFWAGYLKDRRVVSNKPRTDPEDLGGERGRVCDAATGDLLRHLEKTGLYKPGDPGFGDAGGEMTWAKRDLTIASIQQLLLKHGLVPPDFFSQKNESPAVSVAAPAGHKQPREVHTDSPSPPSRGASELIATQNPAEIWSWVLLILLASALVALIRRMRKS